MSSMHGSMDPYDVFSSEEYFRVSIHLPVANAGQKLAAKAVIARLQYKYFGSTYSNVDQPCFIGKWWDQVSTTKPIRDLISIFTIDVKVISDDDAEKENGDQVADDMWREAEKEYIRFSNGQITFWVSIARVTIRSKFLPPNGAQPQPGTMANAFG